MCVCISRCSSVWPQGVNAPCGPVQHVRPADEPCQTTPVYLSLSAGALGLAGKHQMRHKRERSHSLAFTQLCIQYTKEYTPRHTQASTRVLLNKHTTRTGDQNSPKTRSYHSIIIFFFFRLFFFTAFSFSLNVLISVHTYFGALNRVRDSPPLLKQIQTSIKRHMACLPVSDRWCRCTFQKRRAGATQYCWQNNVDRREAGPHVAFIKQDRDTDYNELRSV